MRWNIGWGITSKCNMKCKFCYSEQNRKASTDLNYSDWVRFIDENHDKINSINYGTGENALCDEWFTFVEYVRTHYPYIRQSVTTNGYLSVAVCKENNYRAFVNSIDEVDVSLDFATKKEHTEFRGQPLAYDWALSTLELCQKLKKQATIVFLGSKQNLFLQNIKSLFVIAKNYNAILRMNIYRPTNGINADSEKFILDRDTLICILKYINKNHTILSLGDAYLSPLFTGMARHDPSGNLSIRILSDGSITPSTYLINHEYIVGNIQEKNVLSLIESEKRLSAIMSLTIPDDCKNCVYKAMCGGGVYDRRFLWYGTLNKKDPYCDGPYSKFNPSNFIIQDTDFTSVHNDYLPTIFFKP